ncbi:MAG: DUF6932 family protein [Anaerolineaceae bacterium]
MRSIASSRGGELLIPVHSISGVLPPYLPNCNPAQSAAMSPYQVSLLEVAEKFVTSAERAKIFKGFLNFRKELKKEGFVYGFQWIDGSFVENCEANRNRPPEDIDVTTFSPRPDKLYDVNIWKTFINSKPELFDPLQTKKSFMCHASFVDLRIHPIALVNQTKYWFGLFSHQRITLLWKGMLEVQMQEDDLEAQNFMQRWV